MELWQHPILHFEHADNFVLAYYAGGDAQPKGLPLDVQPEVEAEPGAWTVFDQRGPTVYGPQTNIASAQPARNRHIALWKSPLCCGSAMPAFISTSPP